MYYLGVYLGVPTGYIPLGGSLQVVPLGCTFKVWSGIFCRKWESFAMVERNTDSMTIETGYVNERICVFEYVRFTGSVNGQEGV